MSATPPPTAPTRPAPREQTPAEEIANAVTHGLGLLLSVAGLSVGVVLAALRRDPWCVVSVSVYGATLCLLYLSSTFYHAVTRPSWKRIWNILDHASIYLLIAGTYTPYTLVPLRQQGCWGWSLFGIIWGLAVAGTVFQALWIHRFRVLSVATYLLMGWFVLAAVYPLWRTIGTAGLLWIAAGGLCYTLGVVFYAWKRLRFAHMVWHLFVLAGSTLHFLGVLFHVVLRTAPALR